MIVKICKRCGKPLPTGRKYAYFCEDCSKIAKRETVIRPRTCKECGVIFSGYPRSFYCPECSERRKKENAARYRKSKNKRPIGSEDICQNCGEKYIVCGPLQIYCKNCSGEIVSNKIRAHKRQYAIDNKEKFDEYQAKMLSERHVCVICGKIFTAHNSTNTCSEECRKKQRRIVQNKTDIRRGKRHIPANATRESTNPQSGVRGVSYRSNGKWQATYRGKYLGVFESIELASNAIEQYKRELS